VSKVYAHSAACRFIRVSEQLAAMGTRFVTHSRSAALPMRRSATATPCPHHPTPAIRCCSGADPVPPPGSSSPAAPAVRGHPLRWPRRPSRCNRRAAASAARRPARHHSPWRARPVRGLRPAHADRRGSPRWAGRPPTRSRLVHVEAPRGGRADAVPPAMPSSGRPAHRQRRIASTSTDASVHTSSTSSAGSRVWSRRTDGTFWRLVQRIAVPGRPPCSAGLRVLITHAVSLPGSGGQLKVCSHTAAGHCATAPCTIDSQPAAALGGGHRKSDDERHSGLGLCLRRQRGSLQNCPPSRQRHRHLFQQSAMHGCPVDSFRSTGDDGQCALAVSRPHSR